MLKKLFSDLESRDDKKMKQAFECLKQDKALKAQAEKRYLKLIQARLGDTATLYDLAKAAPTEEEVALIQKTLSHDGYLTLEYFEDAQSKALVELVGGIIASSFDVDQHINKLKKITKYDDLFLAMQEQDRSLGVLLKEQIELSSNSRWFAKIAKKIKSAKNCYQWVFDHTQFESANESIVLKEFIYFLFEKKRKKDNPTEIFIDVFQSTAPNLTAVIWLMVYRTTFKIMHATTLTIPESPLTLGLNKYAHFKTYVQSTAFLDGKFELNNDDRKELGAIFRDLESRKEEKIEAALKELAFNAAYKRIAERRYLKLIQARLNNPNATLADIFAASPKKREVNLITSDKYLDPKQ